MLSKFVGCILLIVGTSIGAGMLALPIVTANGDMLHIVFLMIAAWLVMTVAALYLLEVSFAMPKGTNLISMAQKTLGRWGMLVTWVSYLMLLYCLVSAYIAGGGDLLDNLLGLVHWHLPHWFLAIAFLLLLGAVVYKGIRSVDLVNRALMSVKLLAFFLLLILVLPKVHLTNLQGGGFKYLHSAILVIITSFGYAIILPSMRDYFDGYKHGLRAAVCIGSLVPLLCYVFWVLAVHGVISSAHWSSITALATPLNGLLNTLTIVVNSAWIRECARVFSYVCITTSFLGVSLALTDFLSDGLRRYIKADNRGVVFAVAYVPPLLMVLFYPAAFIHGLALAGVFCVILLMILPALMFWSLFYRDAPQDNVLPSSFRWILGAELLVSVIILFYAVYLAV